MFRDWVGQYGATVWKVARAYSGTADDCQDLTQEILLQVWRSLPKFQGRASTATWSYRVALTDLEMPRMDGFELLAELGRSGALATTPVLVTSTRCDLETRRRVLRLGARAFVPKPVERADLARALEAIACNPSEESATQSAGVS